MLRLSLNGIALIKSFEGFSPIAYRCSASVLTIGYGFTDGVKEGDTMSREQADKRLIYEAREYENAVFAATFGNVTQNELDSLTSLAWNIGIRGMERSTVIREHNKGNKAAAAKAFLMWNKAGGKVMNGLVRRRAAEAALYLTPEIGTATAMPQAIDAEKPVTAALQAVVEAFFARFA